MGCFVTKLCGALPVVLLGGLFFFLSAPDAWAQPKGATAVVNRGSGVVLDVERAKIKDDGTKVQQWAWNGTPNQQWQLMDAGGGFVWLRNVESGKALDVHLEDIKKDGATVHQWAHNGGFNQHWKVHDLNNGWYWLENRLSGKALDLECKDLAKNGARLQQWKYEATPNQQWRFEEKPQGATFPFGPFEFDTKALSPGEICTIFQKHRVAYEALAKLTDETILSKQEKADLLAAYKKPIWHSLTDEQGILARVDDIGGSKLFVTRELLKHDKAIAKVLLHEVMHCAGYSHPKAGEVGYNQSAPMRAERCIDGEIVKWSASGTGLEEVTGRGGWCNTVRKR